MTYTSWNLGRIASRGVSRAIHIKKPARVGSPRCGHRVRNKIVTKIGPPLLDTAQPTLYGCFRGEAIAALVAFGRVCEVGHFSRRS
jgi:hypothetical protein